MQIELLFSALGNDSNEPWPRNMFPKRKGCVSEFQTGTFFPGSVLTNMCIYNIQKKVFKCLRWSVRAVTMFLISEGRSAVHPDSLQVQCNQIILRSASKCATVSVVMVGWWLLPRCLHSIHILLTMVMDAYIKDSSTITVLKLNTFFSCSILFNMFIYNQ